MSLKDLIKRADVDPVAALIEAQIDRMVAGEIDRNQTHREENSAKFHVSGILTPAAQFCARKQVLIASTAIPGETFNGRTKRIFLNGNAMHDKWQKLFVKTGVAKHIEYQNYSEVLDVTGTPDAVISLFGKDWIVEIKSVHTAGFYQQRAAPIAARLQATMYMYMLAIPRAIVLCENKNDQNLKIYPITFDFDLIEPYLAQHFTVLKYFKAKKLPKCTCVDVSDKLGKGCPFRKTRCFK